MPYHQKVECRAIVIGAIIRHSYLYSKSKCILSSKCSHFEKGPLIEYTIVFFFNVKISGMSKIKNSLIFLFFHLKFSKINMNNFYNQKHPNKCYYLERRFQTHGSPHIIRLCPNLSLHCSCLNAFGVVANFFQ